MALAQSFGSEIDVLHVVSGEAMGQPDHLTEQEQAFLSALHRLVPEQAGGCQVANPRGIWQRANGYSNMRVKVA
jgi:hypothetical protein